MSSSIQISVVIPVYKNDHPTHFEQALESLCKQTYEPLEILVVQDGPVPEAISNVIESCKKKFPFVKGIALEKNIGLSAALNVGIKQVKGNWIARMDADDICSIDRFEKQVAYIQKHPKVDILGSWIVEYDEEMVNRTGVRNLPEYHDDIVKYAKWRCPFNHMTVMFKTKAVMDLGGYKEVTGTKNNNSFGDDYELWARFITKGYYCANQPELLVKVRTGNDFFEKRRSGRKYLKYELQLVRELYQLNLFGIKEYIVHVLSKTLIRLAPAFVVKGVYKTLRKSA